MKIEYTVIIFLSLEREESVESVPVGFSQGRLPWDRAVVQDNTDYKKIREKNNPEFCKNLVFR